MLRFCGANALHATPQSTASLQGSSKLQNSIKLRVKGYGKSKRGGSPDYKQQDQLNRGRVVASFNIMPMYCTCNSTRLCCYGQFHDNGRVVIKNAFNVKSPVIFFHDTPADGEAKSCTDAFGLG